MKTEIIDAKHFAGAVADEVVAVLNEAVAERGSATLVLAGGSTPGTVYRALSRPPRTEALAWSKVRLYLGDERWVSAEDDLSNSRMVRETLLDGLTSEKPTFSPLNTSLGSVEEGAKAYEQLLMKNEGKGGVPAFDLLLLGMGEDGHTASLFPASPLLKAGSNTDALCSVATHPADGGKPGGTRVTMMPKLLLNARRTIVIVSGESKASMVQRALEGLEDVNVLPVRLLKDSKGEVTWFLDSGAAKLLTVSR